MYRLEMSVRDYECDIQGIVNNSVYMNYCEHARHEFLLAKGVNFAQLAAEGIDLVVTNAELAYKAPLKPQDKFYVTVQFEMDGRIKMAFVQQIYREDDTLMFEARTTGIATRKGRPIKPGAEFDVLK